MKSSKGTLFLFLSLFLIHCSNSYVDDVDRSGLYEYIPGHPEVNMVASGIVDEYSDSTFLNVSAEVFYSSLIFKKKEDKLQADLVVEIQFIDLVNPEHILEVEEYPVSVRFEKQSEIKSDNTLNLDKNFPLDPGTYTVNVTVTDQNTNKQTTRSSQVFIPNPTDEISHITNIRVLGKKDVDVLPFQPITTYDLTSELDSIRFAFQVTNNRVNSPMLIRSRLLRINSDTTSARPMSWPNYSTSSIQYLGIRYSKSEEIATSTRTITQPGNVTIEFNFPNLERGNYRFEVYTDGNGKDELYKAREFSIKSKNYPTIKTAHELAAPLIYLMDVDEHEELMAIQDPVRLKQEIDRFWLKNIKNQRIAQNVIELFYERVEEANKQFSNYKEGWKTDAGMMYILFGPPMYVQENITEMMWSYTTNLYDPETNFYFVRPKIKSKYYPFDHYVLQRSQQYFSVNYQQVQLWLTGLILKDNL